jgi:glycosyltransferase involved in cell wall biosynthesis
VVIGILPPPVTGMSLIVDRMTRELRALGRVRVLNLSNGHPPDSVRCRIGKFARFWKAAATLAAWSVRGRFRIYFAPDSGMGMFYNVIVAAIARAAGHRVVLHHEAYAYTERRDWRMALITRILRRNALHVVLSENMRRRFVARYPDAANCVVLSNSFAVIGEGAKPPVARRRLVLGHISNLSVDKGFDLVIETLDAARGADLDVAMVLAGPTRGAREREILKAALERHGARLDYRGPVYGREKERFYGDVDLLLFPTRYRNEADPLVVLEALDRGVPVIAYERGCIAEHVAPGAGFVIASDDDFVAGALALVEEYASAPGKLARLSEAAAANVPALRNRARASLESVVSAIGAL